MGYISTYVEPCPKCEGEDLKTWHSHRCQAWFVICKSCEYEDGREREEYQAIDTWNRNARKGQSQ